MKPLEQVFENKNEKAEIDFPNMNDVDGILRVQDSVLLKNKDKQGAPGQEGFLVNEINRNDLEQAIVDNQTKSLLVVAKNREGNVVGYFLAYDMVEFLRQHPDYYSEAGIDPESLAQYKILYGKHVASDRSIPGIGKELDRALFALAKEKGYTLYLAEICEAPIRNDKSISVHVDGEFSMRRIGGFSDTEGYSWGVYIKYL